MVENVRENFSIVNGLIIDKQVNENAYIWTISWKKGFANFYTQMTREFMFMVNENAYIWTIGWKKGFANFHMQMIRDFLFISRLLGGQFWCSFRRFVR